MTSDNTKQMFTDIPLTNTQQCWEKQNKIGLATSMLNDNGNENIFKSSLDIFNPKRWIPDVVPGEAPISLYKIETFYVCQSRKNYQLLTETRVWYKYCYKHLYKIDKKITAIP